MIKNENIFLNILYLVRLEPTISTLTVIRSIQMARRDSNGYRIRKYISLKSILFIMFANLKLVLRSYTSLNGICMSPSLTLFSYISENVLQSFDDAEQRKAIKTFYFPPKRTCQCKQEITGCT